MSAFVGSEDNQVKNAASRPASSQPIPVKERVEDVGLRAGRVQRSLTHSHVLVVKKL